MAKNGRSSVETVVVGMSLKSEYNKLDYGQRSNILEIVTYSALGPKELSEVPT